MKEKIPADFPYEIRTAEQADDIGLAIHQVLHFERDWVSRVFNGDSKLCYQTGPEVIMAELRSMWQFEMSDDERRRIMSIVAIARLSR